MNVIADPWWPVVGLALIQAVDAALCRKPAQFVQRCLDDVRCPARVRPWLTPIKLAASVGLVAGLWVEYLGALTCLALVAYFAIAIAMHLRANDIGRNLLNATGVLAMSAGVTLCFV